MSTATTEKPTDSTEEVRLPKTAWYISSAADVTQVTHPPFWRELLGLHKFALTPPMNGMSTTYVGVGITHDEVYEVLVEADDYKKAVSASPGPLDQISAISLLFAAFGYETVWPPSSEVDESK